MKGGNRHPFFCNSVRIEFMVKKFLLGGVLWASVNAANAAEPALWFYSSVDSHTFSEPTSIESFLHDFRGDIRSGEHAFTYNRLETGLRYREWSLGYAVRYDHFLHFSEDVARAYHASSHDQVLPAGIPYQVHIESSHIRAAGPVLGWQWQASGPFNLGIRVSQLNADKMVDGVANGTILLSAADEYSGQVHFDLYSSEDLLLEMPVPDPAGQGYALDLAIAWQINLQWQMELEIRDAYSRIDWDDVLYSDLRANTATVTFDPAGRLHTDPVLSGYQYLTDVTQTLPRKYHGRLHYQFAAGHAAYVEHYYVPVYLSQTVLGYAWAPADQVSLGAYWNMATRGIGVTGEWHWLRIKAGTDQLEGQQAHVWDLELALQIPLF